MPAEMTVGMLWFDDTLNRPLGTKVEQAMEWYRRKHGRLPNVCYVHPAFLPGESVSAKRITVLPDPLVLPHHLWLGVRQASDQG